MMTEVESDLDSRFEDVDVESILARCERRTPVTFTRKRILYQAPEFTKRLPATETVEEGSTVTFACKVVGFPKPTITWYKDDDVITEDSRAKIQTDDTGVHSIQITDVSKCDGGTYKVRASNLEGASSSSLYITVKAKSKLRNKKKHKRKGKTVARSPLFPAIIELVAEENRETLEIELQPESPLTPIYCTISRKTPVLWPAFLGDWAYNNDDLLQKFELEDLEIECEDVFEAEDGLGQSQTFDNAAYKEHQSIQDKMSDSETISTNNNCVVCGFEAHSRKQMDDSTSRANCCHCLAKRNSDEHCKIDDNRTENDLRNNNTINGIGLSKGENKMSDSETNGTCVANNTPLTNNDSQPAMISVNRSYAKGTSTFSVAKRSPSPFSTSRKPMTNDYPQQSRFNRCDLGNRYNGYDVTTLQNLNNERILSGMRRQKEWCSVVWERFTTSVLKASFDDYLSEVCLLISAGTFLALCFDLTPASFVFMIVLALGIKLILSNFIHST